MNLTKEQKEVFDKEGYLFFPSIFSQKEVQNLLYAVPEPVSYTHLTLPTSDLV